MALGYARGKICVLALGGNSLIRKGERGDVSEQIKNAERITRHIFTLVTHGYNLVITHGNGPQVGQLLLQQEACAEQVPPMPLDVCVAYSEGSMGYLLQQALLNELRRHQMRNVYVVTMITQVLVDKNDPAFKHPTKPVGPFMDKKVAEKMVRTRGWSVMEDAGRGWRRVVPSPRPLKVIQRYMIRDLARQGNIVIALGGGGIPVVKGKNGDYVGVEAVIDKDLASANLAKEIHADIFAIVTEVPNAYLWFGTKRQKPLHKVSLQELRHYYNEGHFPPGSMGPKVQAAIEFLESEDGLVIITDARHLRRALELKEGTLIRRHWD
ncbi:MAG: carbamate kinase [Planctomycetota bacterium]|nr:MAG: carbamate kinase [Planctomycetota bacterium]